jgi:hypothetical protein
MIGNMNTNYAAGILLLSWDGNDICILLGQDNYNAYSDYGGKCDSSDKSLSYVTAAREMYEETLGIFCDITETIYSIFNTPYITSKSFTNKPYYMYFMWIEYDPHIIIKYNTVYNYVCSLQGISHQFKEKKMLSWFKLKDLLNNKTSLQLRNVFYKTLHNHKQRIWEIALELKGRNIKCNYGGH